VIADVYRAEEGYEFGHRMVFGLRS
jgi:hypothetical protein